MKTATITYTDGRALPVFGDLAGDPPPPIGPVTAPGGLHILPGDQRQQPHRRGSLLVKFSALQRRQ